MTVRLLAVVCVLVMTGAMAWGQVRPTPPVAPRVPMVPGMAPAGGGFGAPPIPPGAVGAMGGPGMPGGGMGMVAPGGWPGGPGPAGPQGMGGGMMGPPGMGGGMTGPQGMMPMMPPMMGGMGGGSVAIAVENGTIYVAANGRLTVFRFDGKQLQMLAQAPYEGGPLGAGLGPHGEMGAGVGHTILPVPQIPAEGGEE